MKDETKDLIKNLTQTYIRDATQLGAREKKLFKKVTEVHKDEHQSKGDSTWSADFVEGKGEGLTILLHGKPGVGKTYTAGKRPPRYVCIHEFTMELTK
jgi:signal recognition particle GTPase